MHNSDIIPHLEDEDSTAIAIKFQTVDDVQGCLIVYLTGYIDIYNWEWFVGRISIAIEKGYSRLIFHCAGMNMVSSCMIASFISILKLIKPNGGDLVFLEMQPKVFEALNLLGFGQFFNIKENLLEACKYFV